MQCCCSAVNRCILDIYQSPSIILDMASLNTPENHARLTKDDVPLLTSGYLTDWLRQVEPSFQEKTTTVLFDCGGVGLYLYQDPDGPAVSLRMVVTYPGLKSRHPNDENQDPGYLTYTDVFRTQYKNLAKLEKDAPGVLDTCQQLSQLRLSGWQLRSWFSEAPWDESSGIFDQIEYMKSLYLIHPQTHQLVGYTNGEPTLKRLRKMLAGMPQQPPEIDEVNRGTIALLLEAGREREQQALVGALIATHPHLDGEQVAEQALMLLRRDEYNLLD